MGRRTTRMHDALRDALMIEMRDLLAQNKIFQECRTAQTGFERVLIVRDRNALIRRQNPSA